MAKPPPKKPAQKRPAPTKRKKSSAKASGLPDYRDFLVHSEWTGEVYWCVIRKALLALVCAVSGLVLGCYRMRAGDLTGAGLCWGGLSLLGSWLLKPSEAEFTFLGRYNHFLLHPPVIKVMDADPVAQAAGMAAAGVPVAGGR